MLSESTIQQFNVLREGYLAKLGERVADMLRQCEALSDGIDLPVMRDMAARLHNLAGSGRTFGFPEMSEAARRAEQLLQEVIEQHLVWNDSTRLVLRDSLQELHDRVQSVDSAPGEPRTPVDESPRRVLVHCRDHSLDEAATRLMQFDYQVETLHDPESLQRRLADTPPDVLVLHFDTESESLLHELQRAGIAVPPIVVIGARGDFAARLAALRMGGRAFLEQPADHDELLEAVEQLCMPPTGADYRVILIDDDPDQGRYHGLILERAGMQVTVLQQPGRLLDLLSERQPEVIITDLYMPDCDGLELAALLRQIRPAHGIPIIFLSAEQRLEQQIEAIRAGGDDFLATPVRAEQLVATVASNARRYRARRGLMVRDSLTGLLNHHAVLNALRNEVARAGRIAHPLSIALIDIDHFRRVNDGFGHAAGDAVLKGLGHLLLQRLRRSDAVGRLGGEEFLLILPGTGLQDAQGVLEDLRERLAGIRHATAQGDFTVEISAGVAQLRDDESLDDFLGRADTALYMAKRGGRNRVTAC